MDADFRDRLRKLVLERRSADLSLVNHEYKIKRGKYGTYVYISQKKPSALLDGSDGKTQVTVQKEKVSSSARGMRKFLSRATFGMVQS